MRRGSWIGWALVLAGCAGGGSGGDDVPARLGGAGAETAAEGGADRVSISAEVVAQLDAWASREETMIGDVVEIECTRVPFAAQVAVEVPRETDAKGRRLVERTETSDPATGVSTMTLVNRSGVRTSLDALPKVRISGGRLFVAAERLVLRYVAADGANRPVGLVATASGNATLLQMDPVRRVAGSSVQIRGEVVRGAGGWIFRGAERTAP